jgi:hypothetical protein
VGFFNGSDSAQTLFLPFSFAYAGRSPSGVRVDRMLAILVFLAMR